MSEHDPEPRTITIEHSFCRFTRNSKGDTQVEIKVLAGESPEEMARIREIALAEYTSAVVATGGLVG